MQLACPNIVVQGAGLAICAAVVALDRKRIIPRCHLVASNQRPAIVLDRETICLLKDIFQPQELFRFGHQIRRRVVCWGVEPPRILERAAISIEGTNLYQSLTKSVSCHAELEFASISELDEMDRDADWTITSSSTSDGSRIGKRLAICVQSRWPRRLP